MISVFKTTLEVSDEQKVTMQKGSAIIKVAEQRGKITLWYVCNPEAELVEETFYVIGTGQMLPDTFAGAYLNSVQMYDPTDPALEHSPREFVWHVFFKQHPNVQRGKPVVADPNDPAADVGKR